MNRSQLLTPSGQSKVFITSPSTLLLLAVVFLLSWGFVALAPLGSLVAAWWPAAGVSVILMLRLNRWHQLWGALAIMVVAILSNLAGGRDFDISFLFGIANSVESWLVAFILNKRGRTHPLLNNLGTTYRLFASTAAGAILVGFLFGIVVLVFEGGQLIPTWIEVSAAHATAILIIVPFALIPREQLTQVHLLEIVFQLVVLTATLLYVFGPGSALPLSFLLVPVLAWAAFRFPAQVMLLEIVGLALAISFLTGGGGGPFDQAVEVGANPSMIIQIFLLSLTSFALLAMSLQNENRVFTTLLEDREKIIRGGFTGSRVGLLIVERYRQGFIVLESNEKASSIITNESITFAARHGEAVTFWKGSFASQVLATVRQRVDKLIWQTELDGERADIEILIAVLRSSAGTRYSIQFIDVSAARRTAEAQQLALEKEQIATARLTELNRQKEEFVASASHELRTPITSIIGYVELLEDEELDDFQRSSVETIARNARRLADLVESLLEIGRPRDLKTPAGVSKGAQAVAEVVKSLKPLAKREEITLTIHPGKPISVAVPPIDLERILTNLANNAIKFTRQGGSVSLGLESTETTAILTVTDTGIGMSAEVIEHIFERFYRAPEAETRGITGTGLGLPLVHGLVMKHHGTVTVESEPGEGTTFTVTLPLSTLSEAS